MAPEVILIEATKLEPAPVSWLWEGWLAAGKLHILAGPPGTAKSTLGMALAAVLSRGGDWPDGSRAEMGNVVVWSGEDGIDDTLHPRFLAAGGDATRLSFICGIRDADGKRRSFDPAIDMPTLQDALMESQPRLLIIDSIVSAIAGDSHKNAEVRRSLQPIVDLAASLGCAVLGITHLTKGTAGRAPWERVTGSLAFAALARMVFVTARRSDIRDGLASCVLVRAKSNIGPDGGGFAYRVSLKTPVPDVVATTVEWDGYIEGDARTILVQAEGSGDGDDNGIERGKEFLRMLLKDGPVASKEIRCAAEAAGLSWRTVERAKKALGIEAHKEGGRFGNGQEQRWLWRLP